MIHRMDPPADPDREPMPERIVPMLARPATDAPARRARWSFEVKWDGVRAIAYVQPGRLRLESRNLNEITDAYPEVRGLVGDLGMHEAVLDGEIVAFDESDPAHAQLRAATEPDARDLAGRGPPPDASTPVVYAIFDLLYLDGHALMELPYAERRERLEALGLGGPAWRVPAVHPGAGARRARGDRAAGARGGRRQAARHPLRARPAHAARG